MLLLRSIQQQSIEKVFEEQIGKEAFQDLKKSLGEKCLIILEGLDEIALECQQNDQFFEELINSKLLQYSKIMITSRPHACQKLLKKANKIIEILGFGDKEITEFVQDSFSSIQSSEFLQQLEEHPQLYSLCHVPISLAMIIDIFKEMKSLPSTLTELYYRFIVMMLVRESKKVILSLVVSPIDSAEEKILRQTLPDIPKEKSRNMFLLSKMAFHGFFTIAKENPRDKKFKKIDPKIIFTQNDLTHCGIINTDNYDGHSLLKMEALHHFAGGQITFNFMHLTVQEFLCAVYMSTLSQEEQRHLLQDYFDDYPCIMIFYCGLTKFNLHQNVYFDLTPSSTVTLVRCLYESQVCQQNTALHISSRPFALDTSHITLLPYDCLSLSYVCCYYPVTQLDLLHCNIGDKNIGLLAKWCLNKYTMLQELDLYDNKLTRKGIEDVMKIVTSKFHCSYQLLSMTLLYIITGSPSLTVLGLNDNFIGDDGISLCLQCIDTVTDLEVEKCGLSVEGIASTIFIKAQVFSFPHFILFPPSVFPS